MIDAPPDPHDQALDGATPEPQNAPASQVQQAGPFAPQFGPFQVPLGVKMGMSTQVQVWQGQFPPPEAIEHYERVLPGSFHRIISMAERQQEAVIASSSEARSLLSRDVQRGHWLGWSVTLGALIGAVACAYLKQPAVACVLVAVPVMSVAKAFIDSAKAKVESTPAPTAANTPSSEG